RLHSHADPTTLRDRTRRSALEQLQAPAHVWRGIMRRQIEGRAISPLQPTRGRLLARGLRRSFRATLRVALLAGLGRAPAERQIRWPDSIPQFMFIVKPGLNERVG